jgi:hypothetical protein
MYRNVVPYVRDHEGAEDLYLVCDNHCLPPVIGLVISQFHDLKARH